MAKASGLLRIDTLGVRLADRGKLLKRVSTSGVGPTISAVHHSADPFSVVRSVKLLLAPPDGLVPCWDIPWPIPLWSTINRVPHTWPKVVQDIYPLG